MRENAAKRQHLNLVAILRKGQVQRSTGVECSWCSGATARRAVATSHRVKEREVGDKPLASSLEAKVGSFALVSVSWDGNREVCFED